MSRLIQCVLLCLWLAQSLAAAQSASPAVQVTMREHGYHLGDLLTQRVLLRHVPLNAVDRKSLPLPGPVKPWLDLTEIALVPVAEGTELHLTWQVFATVEAAQMLTLPAWTLKVAGPPAGVVQIPASPFYHSPVFGTAVNAIPRKATRPPRLYALQDWRGLTVAALGLAGLLAMLALWIEDRLPWLPFRPGPLCQAQRRLQRGDLSADAAVTLVYRALGQLAGATLHTANLARLQQQAPYLQPWQREIEAFVQAYSHYQFNFTPLSRAVAQSVTAQHLLATLPHWLPQAALLERSLGRRGA